MAAALNAAQVIRRVRQRLGLTQRAMARSLNATTGAIQHWERGRHLPSLARLLALQQLCRPGRERTQLDALIRQTQTRLAPLWVGVASGGVREAEKTRGATGSSVALSREEAELQRLQRQVAKVHSVLQEKNKQLRILEDRTVGLYRELIALRASRSNDPTKKVSD